MQRGKRKCAQQNYACDQAAFTQYGQSALKHIILIDRKAYVCKERRHMDTGVDPGQNPPQPGRFFRADNIQKGFEK